MIVTINSKTRRFCISLIAMVLFSTMQVLAQDASLQLRYSFEKVSSDKTKAVDESGKQTASLVNGAKIRTLGAYHVLDLGTNNGYLNLGAEAGKLIQNLTNFSIALNVCIDNSVDVGGAGYFIWSFANSDNMGSTQNGTMFLAAQSTRYAITKTNYTKEVSIGASTITKSVWKHITYVQDGTTATIYIDGVAVKKGKVDLLPSVLGATTCNYIGKSPYNGDAYLKKSMVYDFRIYNKALKPEEITPLTTQLPALNTALASEQLKTAIDNLTLDGLFSVTENLNLPAKTDNSIAIIWTSSDQKYITNYGKVSRPAINGTAVDVTLTATLSKNGVSVKKTFIATVPPTYSDKVSVNKDLQMLTLKGNLSNLRSGVTVPTKAIEGSTITWTSSNPEYLSNEGKILKLATKGTGKVKAVLTATLTKGSEKQSKSFDVYVAEDEGLAAYLFVYFIGNGAGEESIRFALSNDGYHYRALNGNKPVIDLENVALSTGVRDPHILRGEDGYFYMVATDMCVAKYGWGIPDVSIILLKSKDLIDWTPSVVDVKKKFSQFSNINRAWAPQTIYDKEKGKYMIYFSMRSGNDEDIIYYSYANKDFTDLETVPQQLWFNPGGKACIDGDMIYENGKYNLFFKTEGGDKGIKKAVSDKINTGYKLFSEKKFDRAGVPVEGAGVFRMINSDTYILMYDMYTSGKYQFTESTDLENFKVIDGDISMNFTPRHGTIMTITQAEAQALAQRWGTMEDLTILSAESNSVKKRNLVVDEKAQTVYIPVKKGTNLSSFNPQLTSLAGAKVTPKGEQDFSKGAVNYQISIDNMGTKNYKVTAKVDNNPVLNGYYADPEILYSHQTNKYYIYPTSDGFTGWSGNYFKTFSSTNLVDWTDEGVILNLPTDVSWASTNAWAPTIVEKKIDGKYKYFYYFCAAAKIGVATSDSPTGKFTDSGKPLIATRPAGAKGGQQIDPDVFTDPKTGKTYLYWGNGYLACAELNPDMMSIDTTTIKIMTPPETFREGVEVFYRNGLYYILWAEDDTRSPEYKVRYATAKSPQGELTIPENNLVIEKDYSRGIYATGHNCILNIEGTDAWYIIYHRFNRPKGITMGDAAGYNREVCIDTLTFKADGSIRQVQPTLEGIRPLFVACQEKSQSIDIYTTKKELNVVCNEAANLEGTITISDLSGKVLMQEIAKKNLSQIKISKLKAGQYTATYTKNNVELKTCSFIVK